MQQGTNMRFLATYWKKREEAEGEGAEGTEGAEGAEQEELGREETGRQEKEEEKKNWCQDAGGGVRQRCWWCSVASCFL